MMKRAIGYGIVVLLLAFAVGCKKDKKKEGEAPADDKAGEMKGGETAPAGGETAPAGGETAPAGGETAPAGGGTAMAPADICKKIEEMATKEGGKALDLWNKNLKGDCEKEMNEAKTKDEAKFNEFTACVAGKATMTEAMDACKQID
jgi:hypothetical protein